VYRNPTRVLIPLVLSVFVLAGFASVIQAQAPKEPDSVVLKGSPMGGVKFNHKAHAHDRGAKCETCHHASKPEKPMKAAQEKCQDCHTKTATAPMKTKTQAAFHDPMAKKGTCVDCHNDPAVKAKAKGPLPAKCQDCHKKENV
jgi:Class III cytochrome C family